MSKYLAKVGQWETPSETSGSIQNTSANCTIEVTSNAEANEGLTLSPMQIINFDGTVYVRSAGKKDASFTVVPFKVVAGGGGGGGGGSQYTLPTASASVKGGIKVGSGLTMSGETLSADKQLADWKSSTSYKVGDTVIYNGEIYQASSAHTSGSTFDINKFSLISSSGGLTQWKQNTNYTTGDFVVYGNFIYRCASTHTSGTTFDKTKFTSLRAKSHLFDYDSPVAYYPNELIYVNGSIYRCLNMHSSPSTFDADIANLELVHSDLKKWAANTYYTVGVTVVDSGTLYMCNTNHTSGTTFDTTEESNWDVVGGGDNYTIPDWETAKEYKVGNIVYYYGTIYRANTAHTSNTFSADNANWTIIYSDLENWQSSVYYKAGTTTIYNNVMYKCVTAHLSTSSFDESKWQKIGGSTLTAWTSGKSYNVGDKVIFNNSLYTANTAHTSLTFASDSSNWNLIYADIKIWQASSYYTVGVVVINGTKIYRCITAHTSESTFDSTEEARWTELGGSGSGFDNWATDTAYTVGDIVVYGDIIYKCLANHTSDSTSFDVDRVKWKVFHTPSAYVNDWASSIYYELNQLVIYDDKIYRCISTHTSGTTFDSTKWDLGDGIYHWQGAKPYNVNDIVIYSDKLFVCTTAHTSSSTFSASNWELLNNVVNWQANTEYYIGQIIKHNNIVYVVKSNFTSGTGFIDTNLLKVGGGTSITTWTASTEYESGDIVIYANSLYRCVTTHTSSIFSTDLANWTLVFADLKEWENSTYYSVGVCVIDSDRYIWRCKTNHTSGLSFDTTEKANWEILGGGAGIDTWTSGNSYSVGEFVIYHNKIYQCLTANTDSSFDPSKWQEIGGIGDYQSGVDYFVGELVFYNEKLYRCKADHTSISTFDNTKWSVVGGRTSVEDWATSTSYKVGEIVVNGNNLYKCLTAHTSSTFSADIANWQRLDNIYEWQASKAYAVGDLVIYSNAIYRCISAHTSSTTFDSTKWSMMGGTVVVQPYENTPIGTIISYMGQTPPDEYLTCDGTVYNISAYQELADFINTQFGSYNYFGGDGTTTFAVPDLRGEFLRGTGANSHANQGGGSSVGTHQNSTAIPFLGTYVDGSLNPRLDVRYNPVANTPTTPANQDSEFGTSSYANHRYYIINRDSVYTGTATVGTDKFTVRPTNTAVLYCIKYTNSPVMQPENIYSTVEKRIGTWIDGKPVYQKTYTGTTPTAADTTSNWYNDSSLSNVETLISLNGSVTLSSSNKFTVNLVIDTNNYSRVWPTLSALRGIVGTNLVNCPFYITIKYTKI